VVVKMMGKQCTLNDIVLAENIEEMILPAPLLCEESLSPDDSPEEESLSPYRVESTCYTCQRGVRVCVVASEGAIHLLQQLLSTDLSLFCPTCSRVSFRHGRNH